MVNGNQAAGRLNNVNAASTQYQRATSTARRRGADPVLDAVGDPGGDQVGGLGPGAVGLLQVVIGLDELQRLVRRGQRAVQRAGVTLIDAGVRRGVDDQGGQGDL